MGVGKHVIIIILKGKMPYNNYGILNLEMWLRLHESTEEDLEYN